VSVASPCLFAWYILSKTYRSREGRSVRLEKTYPSKKPLEGRETGAIPKSEAPNEVAEATCEENKEGLPDQITESSIEGHNVVSRKGELAVGDD